MSIQSDASLSRSANIANSVARARRHARHQLPGSPTAQLDADLLLAHVLGLTRAQLLTHPEREITDPLLREFDNLIARRAAHEPVAQLLGHKEFYGLDLSITSAVLVPRADTEVLVDAALARMDHLPRTVLDLGTGSGAIALALASMRPDWRLVATDISAAALTVALENCLRHDELGVQLRLVRGPWTSAFAAQCADAIVSNPPYVDGDEPIPAELRYEPAAALFAADHGYADLRCIIADAPRVLRPGGWLLLEHGATQGNRVRTLMQNAGFQAISTERDLAGHERVTAAQQP